MTNELPPRDDDPADGQVGNALWRLRARLVTPPAQQRVDDDLERILAAAKLHAHEAPATAAATTAGPSDPDPAAGNVYPLHPAWQAVQRVARVAAAVVLVAGVGGGIASARDGGSIAHLLGLRAADPVDMDVIGPEGSPSDVEVARDRGGADDAGPLASPEPLDEQASAEGADASDPDAPTGDADSADADDTSASSGGGDASSGVDGDAATDAESGDTSSDPEPSAPVDEPDLEPDLLDDEPVMADAPVVDEGRIDGAGGGVPCEDDDTDCALTPVEDDTDTSDEDADAAEELANRRFKAPVEDDTAGDTDAGNTSDGKADDGGTADGDTSP